MNHSCQIIFHLQQFQVSFVSEFILSEFQKFPQRKYCIYKHKSKTRRARLTLHSLFIIISTSMKHKNNIKACLSSNACTCCTARYTIARHKCYLSSLRTCTREDVTLRYKVVTDKVIGIVRWTQFQM